MERQPAFDSETIVQTIALKCAIKCPFYAGSGVILIFMDADIYKYLYVNKFSKYLTPSLSLSS